MERSEAYHILSTINQMASDWNEMVNIKIIFAGCVKLYMLLYGCVPKIIMFSPIGGRMQ